MIGTQNNKSARHSAAPPISDSAGFLGATTKLFNMQTPEKPSDIINQAITNLMGLESAIDLRAKLFECMKEAVMIEIKEELLKKKQ